MHQKASINAGNYLHLLVNCASRAFSDVKCSSRSNRSSFGGGSSRNDGGNTCKADQWQTSFSHSVDNLTLTHNELQ